MSHNTFGHLFRVGFGPNIMEFVAAHSAWELIAIAISGGAGLQMGFSLVMTHGRTRLGNLQAHALELLRQVMGAAAFLTVAAALEGFVSPSALPKELKFAIGGVGFVMVVAILGFWGRGRKPPDDVLELRGVSKT